MTSAARFNKIARRALEGPPRGLVPLRAGGETIGAVLPEFAAALARWPDVFQVESDFVAVKDPRTLPQVTRRLADDGWIGGWRDETYAVRGARGTPLFHIERAAMRRFGLVAHAAHANVLAGQRMWIARRSAGKPIDPGRLDNLVGGGIASGATAFGTLLKEAREEAGIDPARAARARYVKALMVERTVPDGLHREVLHVYDLRLAPGFRPRNLDGEVSAFYRVDRRQLAALLVRGEFTADAGLVALDWLQRAGAGGPELARLIARSERRAAAGAPDLVPIRQRPRDSGARPRRARSRSRCA